ncbi:MAG: glycoside hydrolase family 127 protein [Lachnospiraceae bacterium]|nr:glycoside hydrolase family 127 protein [Lachnospiraceae bacterium]
MEKTKKVQEGETEMFQDIQLKNVRVDDPFWSQRQKLLGSVTVPYQEDILYDRIPGIEKSHAIANLKIAAGLMEGEFYGMVFQDSDIAKWIEGAAFSLALFPDPELEKRIDEVIDLIEQAQLEDGYFDTYFIVKEPGRCFQNLQEGHELYCAGHLIEAAVAYYEVTGKDRLLHIVERMVDCIRAHIGPEEGKIRGVPGHEEIELALMKLYRLTKDEKYEQLASYFVYERGNDPDFFENERKNRGWAVWGGSFTNIDYHQVRMKAASQTRAVGHSVRAMYYYTAMADLAEHRQDQQLADACRRLWENVTSKQMYITGNIGQEAAWEGFTNDYELPNDLIYGETCASIGMVFWARRMLEIQALGSYADVMELELFNGVLSGMQMDGKHFFYVNPLEVNPGVSGVLPEYRHVLPERPEWYACACCPPNVVRLILSIEKYAWGEKEHTIYSHLFLGGEARFDAADLTVHSEFPRKGRIEYLIRPKKESFTFAVRIPGYARNVRISRNGILQKQQAVDGYVYFEGGWAERESVLVEFDMPLQRQYANPLVRADAGCVAFRKGPFIYCAEGADNAEPLQELRIPDAGEYREIPIEDGVLKGITAIQMPCRRAKGEAGFLYTEKKPELVPETLTLIPYFAWGNRGVNQMRVWLHAL